MAEKRIGTQIIDHVDGQPAIVLSNGNWGQFDPKTNEYKDTGIKASPEDDSTAMKYYKLGNTSTPPEAPTKTGGWDTLAGLNSSLSQAGWAEDPLQTSNEERFCWTATYGKENVVDTVATEASGHLIFKPKFTRTNVRLWANYAASPTMKVENGVITITNPDGTTETQQIATAEAVSDLVGMLGKIQEQIDGAVYSYSMEGVPTMSTLPTSDWRKEGDGTPITDPALIADIYLTHVGDTYTDLETYRSYRFEKVGSSASNPASYEWVIIADDALSSALAEIARLGREKTTTFTVQPTAYHKGDMWLQADNTTILHALQDSEVFVQAHWVQLYATKAELDAQGIELGKAKADAKLSKDALEALGSSFESTENTVAKAIKDNIIDSAERAALTEELKQSDAKQESLLTTVNYLIANAYLPAAPKGTLEAKKAQCISAGGSMDQYQQAITDMIADGLITPAERVTYNSKYATYAGHLKQLEVAIAEASKAVDAELKRLADEKVDKIEVGGRNLITLNTDYNAAGLNKISDYEYKNLWVAGIPLPKFEDLGLIEGNKYTFSFEVRTDNEDKLSIFSNNQIKINDNLIAIHNRPTLIMGQYVKVVSTFTYIDGVNENYPLISLSNVLINSLYIRNFKLEKGTKATDWTPAPEDIQSQIDLTLSKVDVEYALGTSPTVAPTTGWATTSPVWQVGKYVWSRVKTITAKGDIKYSNEACIQAADGKGIVSITEQYAETTSPTEAPTSGWVDNQITPDPTKYTWTRNKIVYTDSPTPQYTKAVRATGMIGKEGEDAINVIVTRQGSYRTYWRQIGSQGQILTAPEKVSEVVGGVEVGGIMYVQCRAIIYKGSVDVTASAKTKGGNFKWFVNDPGKTTPMATGEEFINLPVSYADGKDDDVVFQYDDVNAKTW